MKLIFVSGVAGVGKTTLLTGLKNQFHNKIILLNPGELFRRYFYDQKMKSTEEIEEMIVNILETTPPDAVVVLHWHYAVKRPERFMPHISFSRMRKIAKNKDIERVVLFLIEASVDTIYKRRVKEREIKKRPLSKKIIREEMCADIKLLSKHYALFSQIIGTQRVTVFKLANEDLKSAKATLYTFVKALLD